MANFPALKMTAAGRVLQSKAQTGQLLKFTRIGLGDGEFSGSPDLLAAMVSEKQSLSIQSQKTSGDGTSILRVIATNQGLAQGFYMREVGAYAEDPDTGEEVLYSYTNAGLECDFLPGAGGAVTWEGVFDLITVVGNAANVTAVIDDFITIALKSDVDELRPYILPAGGLAGDLLVKSTNEEGKAGWQNVDLNGLPVRFSSIEEPRIAVANQKTFTLQKTITNGLAVYVGTVDAAGVGSKVVSRLPREAWTPVSATQLKLTDALAAGTPVLFVNNEEAGVGIAVNVSLKGPTLVYPGSTNTYTLSDFDSFSLYTQSATAGTLTRTDGTLTLVIPADAPAGTLDLSVTRDNVAITRRIAIGSAAIATPEIVSPTANSTGVGFQPDLVASAFVVYPAGFDKHVKTRWQVALDAAFTQLVYDAESTTNLTAINLGTVGIRLDPSKQYFTRAKFTGQTLLGAYSVASSFNTAAVYIRRPAITSPLDGAVNVSASVTITGDAFSVYGGADTHIGSRWQLSVTADFSTILDDSGWTATQLTSYKTGNLGHKKRYYVRFKYKGQTLGESDWSVVTGFTTSDQLSGTYTQMTGGSTGKSYFGYALAGRKLYTIDGLQGQNTFWEYDFDSGVWKQLVHPGYGSRYGCTMTAVGSKLYVCGGYTGSYQAISYSDLWCYDIPTAKWTQLASNGTSGMHGSVMSAIGQKLYLVGGNYGSSLYYDTLRIYDIATNTWSVGPSMFFGRRAYHAQGVIGGKIYIHGGNTAGNTNTTECYDPVTNKWTAKAAAPLTVQQQRHGTSFAVVADKLYVFGGYTGSYLNVWFNDLYVYDASLDTWVTLPSGAVAAEGGGAVSLDEKIFMFAGQSGMYTYLNSLWAIA